MIEMIKFSTIQKTDGNHPHCLINEPHCIYVYYEWPATNYVCHWDGKWIPCFRTVGISDHLDINRTYPINVGKIEDALMLINTRDYEKKAIFMFDIIQTHFNKDILQCVVLILRDIFRNTDPD